MANLKDLKARIGSVKSTQKITKAMQMVSASKLRRACEKVEAAKPYAEGIENMVKSVASNISESDAPGLLLGSEEKSDTHLIVAISSDRGLCGGFNAYLVKAVKKKVQELKAKKKNVKIICIGKKGYEQIKSSYSSDIIDVVEGISKKKAIPYEDAEKEASRIIEMFENDEFDVCTIFYNKFISAISQEVTEQQIIPLDIKGSESEEVDAVAVENVVYEYEPNKDDILEKLLPKNIAVQIYHAFLENSASEHGARMSAMDNATRNAGEMIKKLTLVYNRTRQAAITTELIEIIAGAEAL